jgi:RNA polymerase sigma-70 factor, ECF subfamily
MADNNIDFELVKRFIDGDESAFNKIIERYRQRIYWHARRMTGNHLDADEVVQEVLIVIYKKLKDFKFKSSLYTWIYRITTTRSINFVKSRKIKLAFGFEEKGNVMIKSGEDIISNIENKEKLERLDRTLQKLPAKQREVFILRNFEELSYEEIAELTGKSVGGLKANYFHAIQKVMELMANYENK